MDRRTLLGGMATALCGLAGCSGDGSEPQSGRRPPTEPADRTTEQTPAPTPVPLRVPAYSFEESADGATTALVTVSNPGPEPRETTMTVVVTGRDGQQVSGSTDIAVASGEQQTYRVTIDVAWSWFRDNRNLRGVEFADAS